MRNRTSHMRNSEKWQGHMRKGTGHMRKIFVVPYGKVIFTLFVNITIQDCTQINRLFYGAQKLGIGTYSERQNLT